MTKNTATAKPETKHLSITLPVGVFNALQDYRHDKRIDRVGPAAVEFLSSGLRAATRPDGTAYLPADEPTLDVEGE